MFLCSSFPAFIFEMQRNVTYCISKVFCILIHFACIKTKILNSNQKRDKIIL